MSRAAREAWKFLLFFVAVRTVPVALAFVCYGIQEWLGFPYALGFFIAFFAVLCWAVVYFIERQS